jgi:AraC-like DNA-binding protein
MHAPVDRSPLHRHIELLSHEVASTAELLRSKGFELSLPAGSAARGIMRINAIDLASIHLCYVSYGTDAVVTTTPARTDYRIQLPLAGRSVTLMEQTETLCQDAQAVVSSPLYDQTIRSSADCQRLMVYFTGEALTRHLNAMLGEGIASRVRFAPSMDLTRGVGRSLLRWVTLAVEELDRSDALLHNPLALAQFEQLLLTGLVCGQPHNLSAMLDRPAMVSPRSVKRAIDFIRANLQLPITVGQLVGVAGVPGRTLYKHFRQTTGLAPLAYVRKARFEAVRRDLLDGSEQTVTAIAARWGFDHMGRFAHGYRLLFGERPSETQRGRRR